MKKNKRQYTRLQFHTQTAATFRLLASAEQHDMNEPQTTRTTTHSEQSG